MKKTNKEKMDYHGSYREKSKMTKRMCKKDKMKYLEKKCEKIELSLATPDELKDI